jgi:N utilization substance protein B
MSISVLQEYTLNKRIGYQESFMGRREIREQLFKLLFRIEFNAPEDMEDQKELFFEEEPQINEKDMAEIKGKFDGILEKLSEIDAMINERVTGWKTARMGKVDLTILRVAVYEICFDESVPTGVAINEAVELAKKYGQEESSSFVNGVLAKFAEK